MNYSRAMGIKIHYLAIAILFFGVLSCDPPREFCDDMGTFARVSDIFILEPLQDTYHKGDVVTLKGSIANISPYFAEPNVNLLEVTGVDTAWLIGGATALFDDNSINYIKGSKREGASNWYNMPYSEIGDKYEFEVNITLNRTGTYNFHSSYLIDIIGEGCNTYNFDTNIAGANADSRIEFEVLE
ncbi:MULTISPECIES: hypothetical protein [Aequorivita]|uniref:Uncharacterized protein n=1 Tax=Aequorivita xiaoshiensis TaxID=2874476 RepID=A0A9X1QY00_9FLAO|nr:MULTISPECIES: hypothetical protein [Aequorivita]MCG2429993.1 hypothetical protein [Aequorivita xiaoshiensis]